MSNNDKVVPATIERPKRIAKKLHVLYPTALLSECQHVTSLLFGHTSWYALENSVKSEDVSAPYDEELLEEIEYLFRKNAQIEILIKHFSYPYPDSLKVSRVLPNDSGNSTWLYAADVIDEVSPTHRKIRTSSAWPIIIPLITKENFSRLPELLTEWWKVNIPNSNDVYEQLLSITLNPDKRYSIRSFTHYLETLCLHNPLIIPDPLIIGITFLLAIRYAECSEFDLPKGSKFRMRKSDRPLVEKAFGDVTKHALDYLYTFPHLNMRLRYIEEDEHADFVLLSREAQEMLSIRNDLDIITCEIAWIRS